MTVAAYVGNLGVYLAVADSNGTLKRLDDPPMVIKKGEKNLKHVAVLGEAHYPDFEVAVCRVFKKANTVGYNGKISDHKLQLLMKRIDDLKESASLHSHHQKCKYHDLITSLDALRQYLSEEPEWVKVRNGNAQGAYAKQSELDKAVALHKD